MGNSAYASPITPASQTHVQFYSHASPSRRHRENDDVGEVSPIIPAVPVKVPRGRPKRVNKFNWSDGSTELLIDLWQSKPILFDVKHPEYHKGDKKEKTI